MISVWAVLEVQMKNGNNKQLFSFLTIAPPFDKASSTSSFSCAFARMLASFGIATSIGQTELFSMVLERISGPLKMIVRLLCMWLSHGCFIIIVLFFMSPEKKQHRGGAQQQPGNYKYIDVQMSKTGILHHILPSDANMNSIVFNFIFPSFSITA